MAELERIYTVPLSGAYLHNRRRRARRAVQILRAFLVRHMKAKPENVRLSQELNSYLLSHGMQAPPRKVRLKVSMGSDAIARAELLLVKKELKKPVKKEPKPAQAAQVKTEHKPAQKKPEEKAVKEEKKK